MAPHILLRELSVPFELITVDRSQNAQKMTAYLKLNPNGLIPVLTDGDLVLYESAAICLYLCDRHPGAGLAPSIGTPDAGAAQVKAQAEIKVGVLLDQLNTELALQSQTHASPWLLGANYSAVDAYALMLCRWTRNLESTPARDKAHLGPYLQRVLARPAVVKAFEAEGLAQPWV